MDLTSPSTIKEILSRFQAKPSKGLGQNFLIDKNVLDKIVEASDIKPTDNVLEVGPGIGTLTKKLAEKAESVIAVEKDTTMVEILKETLVGFNNVKIIPGDILRISDLGFRVSEYKVVANIPYYLTSPLIRKLLESPQKPESITLMVQKEVAQRICAEPSEMSLLAVSVQFYALAKIISYVSKNCFWPAPKVDSAIIKIIPKTLSNKKTDPDLFFKIVKAGFSHPRKQLGSNLSGELKISKEKTELWLSQNVIGPKQRAETLSIDDWESLTNSFNVVK